MTSKDHQKRSFTVTQSPISADMASILLVEDDEDARQLIGFLLSRAGFIVSVAIDGEEALKQINSMTPPALVLLDVMMPYLDGFDILAHIRSNKEWQDVPVILLTANNNENDIERAYELGIKDYILKPFKTTELLHKVGSTINGSLA